MLEGLSAVLAAAVVAASAWRLGALDGWGAVAATAVGGATLGFAGLGAALVLLLFFVSASALTALPPGNERRGRGPRQVLANGSVAAAAAVLIPAHAEAALAFLGATAAATADTWATEVGIRLGREPRSILTLQREPPGTSGAVSLPGSSAAVAGAVAVAAAGYLLLAGVDGRASAAVAAGGLLGAFVDSLLGAGLQARYRCDVCGASAEAARHDGCDARATRVVGLGGLDNDAVNWVATIVGAGSALALDRLI